MGSMIRLWGVGVWVRNLGINGARVEGLEFRVRVRGAGAWGSGFRVAGVSFCTFQGM